MFPQADAISDLDEETSSRESATKATPASSRAAATAEMTLPVAIAKATTCTIPTYFFRQFSKHVVRVPDSGSPVLFSVVSTDPGNPVLFSVVSTDPE